MKQLRQIINETEADQYHSRASAKGGKALGKYGPFLDRVSAAKAAWEKHPNAKQVSTSRGQFGMDIRWHDRVKEETTNEGDIFQQLASAGIGYAVGRFLANRKMKQKQLAAQNKISSKSSVKSFIKTASSLSKPASQPLQQEPSTPKPQSKSSGPWGDHPASNLPPHIKQTSLGDSPAKSSGDSGSMSRQDFLKMKSSNPKLKVRAGNEETSTNKIGRLVREQLSKGPKSSEPIKLGASTPVISNPTVDDSARNYGKSDWALSDNVSGAAAATLLPKKNTKNDRTNTYS